MYYKIKDNVDLKILEKYGYEYISNDYGYTKSVSVDQSIDIRNIRNERVIFYDNDDYPYELDEMKEEYIQDLIKDGIVEKVDDN